jgi:hypothetical protein
MPAYYLIASCIIAILTAFFIPETYKKELDWKWKWFFNYDNKFIILVAY